MRYILIIVLVLLVSCQQPSLTITASSTQGEWPLTTELLCSLKPYQETSIMWKIDNSLIAQCNGVGCQLTFDAPGNYTVYCGIEEIGLNDHITIEVTKQFIDITSIVGFGDSLTDGYGVNSQDVWLLDVADFLDASATNLAQSGATSSDVIDVQIPLMPTLDDQTLVFIWMGANDIIQQQPQEQFETNLNTLVAKVKTKTDHIYLITIPDMTQVPAIKDAQQLLQQLGIQTNAIDLARMQIFSFNEGIQQIATEFNVKVIDIIPLMEGLNESYLTADGFHPNIAGHKLIGEYVINVTNDNIFIQYR